MYIYETHVLWIKFTHCPSCCSNLNSPFVFNPQNVGAETETYDVST